MHDIPPSLFISPDDAAAGTAQYGPALLQTVPQYVPQAVLQNPHLQARQRNCAVLVVQLLTPAQPPSARAQPLLPELNTHATEQLPLPPQHKVVACVEHPADRKSVV